MPLYKPHLAAVRAKVAALRGNDTRLGEADRRAAGQESARYLQLAAGYVLPPALIIMCGLPGTGKSRAAHAIAQPLDAAVLRSDAVRKQLAGIDPADRATGRRSDIYSAAWSSRTYAELLERAGAILRGGGTGDRSRAVIVDATMPNAGVRASFVDLARRHGVATLIVYTKAPPAVIRTRLAHRATDPGEVSDADWSVYLEARRNFEPPREVPPSIRLTLTPSRDLDESVTMIIDRLIALLPAGPVEESFRDR
jgi:predicted kinase